MADDGVGFALVVKVRDQLAGVVQYFGTLFNRSVDSVRAGRFFQLAGQFGNLFGSGSDLGGGFSDCRLSLFRGRSSRGQQFGKLGLQARNNLNELFGGFISDAVYGYSSHFWFL
ncbi:hypothetical protein D9M71_666420 [compost metagenome]